MSELKLGALAPQRPFGLSTLDVYAQGKIPNPPASFAPPAVGQWGMMLNDTYGDCTIAGAGHAVMAWNAEVHEHDAVPTDPEIEQTYFSITGGADSGCVEASVLQKWHQQGLFGNTIAGYAPVQEHNLTQLHQAIAFYGCSYLGVALPQSAQEQFPSQEWTVVPGSPIEGGHCILAVGYTQQEVFAVTWGQVVAISYPWIAKYLTEAWCILPHQFVEAGHGPSLDLKSLQADLSRV